MLPKIHRLPLRTELNRVKKQGKIVSGNFFSLLFTVRSQTAVPRFAFIVSKKIDKRATVRNRVRRLFSESVREILPEVKKGVDGAFLAKRSAANQKFSIIRTDVEGVFRKSGLFTVLSTTDRDEKSGS